MIRFAFLPLLLALNFSMCKKQQAVTEKPQPAGGAAPVMSAAPAAPVVAATPKVKKPVVDQTGLTGRYDFQLRFSPDPIQLANFGGLEPGNGGDPNPPPDRYRLSETGTFNRSIQNEDVLHGGTDLVGVPGQK